MSTIDEFITRYHREFDFYSEAGRLAAQQLEIALSTRGIRAIVTARAKRPDRLKAKLEQRARSRDYKSLDDIYQDIVDLAGVRVALYFPADRQTVSKLVDELFDVHGPAKQFPDEPARDGKRFSGYWATHFRVSLKDGSLLDAQKRYSTTTIEIQIASVLMHAWSEVEHDLVYKPLQGTVSEDELAILDELNGLVLSGEIALERLQRAVDSRLAKSGSRFRDQFDLGSHLFEKAREIAADSHAEVKVGRVDLLFELLRELNKDTPERIAALLQDIDPDLESRPLADQVVDRLLAEDPSRYEKFSELRAIRQQSLFGGSGPSQQREQQMAIGRFLSSWIGLERFLRRAAVRRGVRWSPSLPVIRITSALDLPPELRSQIDRFRSIRNNLVHGVEMPDPDYLNAASDQIQNEILKKLRRRRH